jgi:hypothetical protein
LIVNEIDKIIKLMSKESRIYKCFFNSTVDGDNPYNEDEDGLGVDDLSTGVCVL